MFAQREVTGMTLYVYPLPPCSQCAAFIIQSGIKRVVCVTPSQLEVRERWMESNEIAFDMFKQAEVEVKTYLQEEVQ